MNLKRQLLVVSLLTLVLPWAGCEFIRETESALREVQEDMLIDMARALSSSLSPYAEEFPPPEIRSESNNRLYVHALTKAPEIDGYFDDWPLPRESLRGLSGPDGAVGVVAGAHGADTYLYVEAQDRNVVYATAETMILDDGPEYADRVTLVSRDPLDDRFAFAAEAPGPSVSYHLDRYGFEPDHAISAWWQDMPGGYRLEARIPSALLGGSLGVVVRNTPAAHDSGLEIRSFGNGDPAPSGRRSDRLAERLQPLVPSGMRAILTDAGGWRLGVNGALPPALTPGKSRWSRRLYDLLLEPGEPASRAEPDPTGRESQPYVDVALDGSAASAWFRSDEPGQAIVAAAAPILDNGDVIGALLLQQSTDAILSQTNAGLARLINVTLISTLVVLGGLLGYATWLSRRVRRLAVAAEAALESQRLAAPLPSALSGDEIGDLSRSFSSVLSQLGEYNAYLRTLASKLSHELRTPLTIVSSSLENLEHEPLNAASAGYVERAREGATRLRRILTAMSEASRVEELMANAEDERFDLAAVLTNTIAAYRDAYPDRRFDLRTAIDAAPADGSPELLIQMLDKLVDNAVGFSASGNTIRIGLDRQDKGYRLSVTNPGPPLPEAMRSQLFDSMVSMRGGEDSKHLGLGLYVAKLIAEGHGGSIDAGNVDGGVTFTVILPGTV